MAEAVISQPGCGELERGSPRPAGDNRSAAWGNRCPAGGVVWKQAAPFFVWIWRQIGGAKGWGIIFARVGGFVEEL